MKRTLSSLSRIIINCFFWIVCVCRYCHCKVITTTISGGLVCVSCTHYLGNRQGPNMTTTKIKYFLHLNRKYKRQENRVKKDINILIKKNTFGDVSRSGGFSYDMIIIMR